MEDYCYAESFIPSVTCTESNIRSFTLIVVMLSVVVLSGVEPYSQHLIIFVTYKWAQ